MKKIAEIKDRSLEDATGINIGDKLISINGHEINDMLDYRFHAADEMLEIVIEKPDRSRVSFEYDVYENGPFELELEPDPIKRCKNKCVFCFIHQLPKGLRKSLYVKDEDYRLSFTHGNYITLTNLSDEDFQRIIEMRLSPLYISVHTTDEELRKYMLGKSNIDPLMPQIKRLVESEIQLHTQIVVCPGINDKEHLTKTVSDLASFYPHLQSVAIVPVGLTEHRERLPELDPVTHEIANEILEQCDKLQQQYLSQLGTRFLFPADEFFLLTGKPIPPKKYYEDFPQIENGVGMVRDLMSSRKLPKLKLKKKLRATIATGKLAVPVLEKVFRKKLRDVEGLEYNIIPVENRLMGKSVTVSGLLGGEDFYRKLKNSDNPGDMVILPPNCLNDDGLFLDDWTPADLEKKLKLPVVAGCYSMYNTFMPIFRRLT
jgi:putative radical SAM enzyme (TIGR03279 family)